VAFTYSDLFAGIGGFHAALSALDGECWFTSEIDPMARKVYADNWQWKAAGDIRPLTEGPSLRVPGTDVLAAGFPCQPFSKSGAQLGMRDLTRGTLFFNICRILEEQPPAVILLENVRNLAGPRQRDTWAVIVTRLRELGYRVSWSPTVFSPHLLPPERGGRPQVRERVFILGTYVGPERAMVEVEGDPVVPLKPVDGWDPKSWDLERHLPLQAETEVDESRYGMTAAEHKWFEVWNDWLSVIEEDKLPGFPIWADEFRYPPVVPEGTPTWKADYLRKNADLYERNMAAIDDWFERHDDLADLPPSRRKLEWQAQDTARDLYNCVVHIRPSGLRAKRPTYLPALVAINQASVIGPRNRRVTPREAARLQGLPDWFDFGSQPDAATYKQLGNGVSVGAAYYVFREHVIADQDEIAKHAPWLVEAVLAAPDNPDDATFLQARPQPVDSEGAGRRLVDLPSRESELSVL
jgi:DNA (cytosine-5)-methyltransferase 1